MNGKIKQESDLANDLYKVQRGAIFKADDSDLTTDLQNDEDMLAEQHKLELLERLAIGPMVTAQREKIDTDVDKANDDVKSAENVKQQTSENAFKEGEALTRE